MFEGTGKYFWLLFLVLFIIYITVKVCLSHIFKSAKIPGWKAYIPIYNKLVLCDALDLKRSVFYKTLIPFANLHYFNIIIKSLLDAYNLDSKESVLFLVLPMYKFPELVFKNPQFTLHMYDNTERFMADEKNLFEKQPETVSEIDPSLINVQPTAVTTDNTQTPAVNPANPYGNDTVFSNSSLEPDERQETFVEAKVEEEKRESNPIVVDNSRPKVCPQCGTKLPPTSKVCFFCGKEV